jgi:PRC-barrel domain protein
MELLRDTSARVPLNRRAETSRTGKTSPIEPRIGDTVVAQDGIVGHVESVIRSETRRPVFVVVAVQRFIGRRRPVVPWSLVTAVDRSQQRVQLRGRRKTISRLPETVPLVI